MARRTARPLLSLLLPFALGCTPAAPVADGFTRPADQAAAPDLAEAPDLRPRMGWSRRVPVPGTAGFTEINDVAADAAGNVLAAGQVVPQVQGMYMGQGYLAKHSPRGEVLWERTIGTRSTQLDRVAVDPAGNVFVSGYFQGTVDLGTGPLQSKGLGSGFVASYSPEGKVRWARALAAERGVQGTCIAADRDGSVLFAAELLGSLDLGGGPLPGGERTTALFVRFTAGGEISWARTLPSSGQVSFPQIDLADSGGEIFIAGRFSGSVDLGRGAMASRGDSDVFLARLDGAGAPRWVRQLGGALEDGVKDMALDGRGGVAISGHFKGAADFGTGPLMSSGGSQDAYVALYDGQGAPRWARAFGGPSSDIAHGVAVDLQGRVLIGGLLTGEADLGVGPLPDRGGFGDAFMLLLSPAGEPVRGWRFGADSFDMTHAVAVSGGDLLVGGEFVHEADFGQGPIKIDVGSQNGFIAQVPAP